MNLSTPDLFDAHRDDVQVAKNTLKHFGARKVFMGQAVTVNCPADNSKAAEMLNEDGTGKVLVIAAGGNQDYAFVGDQMVEKAVKNNWQGIIVDGCVRDIEILETMEMGVMAIGVIPRSTVKQGRGEKNIEVYCQGLLVEPNDYIYADKNGVLLSKANLL